MSGMLSDNDRANMILKEFSFKDLLKKSAPVITIRTVLTIKDWLFNLLRSKQGLKNSKPVFSIH